MPIGLHDLQLYNHNSVRNFPLAASASGMDTSGSFKIPTSLLVDFKLAVSWSVGLDPGSFYISKMIYFPASVNIEISCTVNSNNVIVAYAVFSLDQHVTNLSYPVVGVGSFRDSRGHITIGDISEFLTLPPGSYGFPKNNTLIDLFTINPNISGLGSLQIDSDGVLSERLQGVVRLAAGRNHRIEVIQESGKPPVVVLNAISGEGLTEDCVCQDESAEPIRTINGVGPDDQGNINLFGGNCVEIEPQQYGLKLNNPCSQPCCGPDALEQVTDQLMLFGSKATTLENFLVRLESEVAQMNLSVLGSRLGDRGCVVPETTDPP
jgi:hypothetical protein